MLPGHQVYRLGEKCRGRLVYVSAILMLLGLSPAVLFGLKSYTLVEHWQLACISAPLVFVFFLLAVIVSGFSSSARLEITPEFAEFRLPGFNLRAHWDQTETITQTRFLAWPAESVKFQTVEMRVTKQARILMALWGLTQAIPLTPFLPNWRKLQVGVYLKPWLPPSPSDPIELDPELEAARRSQERKAVSQDRKAVGTTADMQRVNRIVIACFIAAMIIVCLASLVVNLLN